MYHGYCNKGGCHVDAKNATHVTTIPRAQATGNLDVVTRAHVTKIAVDDRTGLATGVSYVTDGEEFFQPASVVLVASYTYENSRLLLLSKSRPYPNGLSNNHGQVGRHYFSHAQGGGVSALFPFDVNNWYGLPAQGTGVDNFADDNWDHSGVDFIGGGLLWIYSDRRPIAAASQSTWGQAPAWGTTWKAWIREHADRTNGAYLQKTTLPYEMNYLDLDPEVKDPLGLPVTRITADYQENEHKINDYIQDKMEQWYRAAGAIDVRRGGLGTMGPSTHSYGGTRMGDNIETNVVNRWGLSHECPNLGVLGSSVMGTSGARNPTLTLQALAWRTGDYLVREWKNIVKG
jgi:gluconate 2-dehydrogenase alpha chain